MTVAIQHVLVVGDDPQRRGLLQSYLRDLDGTAVDATYGADGLRLAQALKPKVLVIDYPLADLAGEQLCRSAKQDSGNAGIMVLFVGDLGSPECDVKVMIESGADDCCPPVADELRKRVQLLLRYP